MIDSLELFTGLTIFSNSEFEEKIRFLFDLYDFNELNSLSNIDIEFMIVAAQTSCYKIFLIEGEVNEQETEIYVSEFFSEDKRVNVSQFLKWC